MAKNDRPARLALTAAVVALLLGGTGTLVQQGFPAGTGGTVAGVEVTGVPAVVRPAPEPGVATPLTRRTGGGADIEFSGGAPRLRIAAPAPGPGFAAVVITADGTRLLAAAYDAATRSIVADLPRPGRYWGGVLDLAALGRDVVPGLAPRPGCAGRAASFGGVTVTPGPVASSGGPGGAVGSGGAATGPRRAADSGGATGKGGGAASSGGTTTDTGQAANSGSTTTAPPVAANSGGTTSRGGGAASSGSPRNAASPGGTTTDTRQAANASTSTAPAHAASSGGAGNSASSGGAGHTASSAGSTTDPGHAANSSAATTNPAPVNATAGTASATADSGRPQPPVWVCVTAGAGRAGITLTSNARVPYRIAVPPGWAESAARTGPAPQRDLLWPGTTVTYEVPFNRLPATLRGLPDPGAALGAVLAGAAHRVAAL
ncbi:hypothetical protein GTY80_42730, partial [Amycolatopsis sp. SID8362]|nr:hypothetical protein [Amycolatopsis sp. SID8362]NED46642.1 hypothetical protein [Amycolatopsis sp. SID8362]